MNTQTIVTDGNVNNIIFDYKLEGASWVAFRIFNTSYTNPVFVEVAALQFARVKKWPVVLEGGRCVLAVQGRANADR